MKFGVVGVIAFVIDYGLLALLTEAFGVNYLVSATISFTASVVFNYAASMRCEFAIFVVLSVIGLGINNGCMWAGVEFLGIHYLIVKIGATFIVMVWNFVTRKIFLDAGDAPGEILSDIE